MTWSPFTDPGVPSAWGINDRGRTVHPVCRIPGCCAIPASPYADDETGDYCATHLAQIRQLRTAITARQPPGRGGVQLPASCGSDAGHRRHHRKGEDPCDACLSAHSEAAKTYKAQLRERRAAA